MSSNLPETTPLRRKRYIEELETAEKELAECDDHREYVLKKIKLNKDAIEAIDNKQAIIPVMDLGADTTSNELVPVRNGGADNVEPAAATQSQLELKYCESVLAVLLAPDYEQMSEYFRQPATLHVKFKTPMDLGTIQVKLQTAMYEGGKDFEADVRLMFKNCYTIHAKANVVCQQSQAFEKVFEEMWKSNDNPVKALEEDENVVEIPGSSSANVAQHTQHASQSRALANRRRRSSSPIMMSKSQFKIIISECKGVSLPATCADHVLKGPPFDDAATADANAERYAKELRDALDRRTKGWKMFEEEDGAGKVFIIERGASSRKRSVKVQVKKFFG